MESGVLAKKDIKRIIGVGFYWAPYKNEIEGKLGYLKEKIEIVSHDADGSEMKYYEMTSYGYPIEVNWYFAFSEIPII